MSTPYMSFDDIDDLPSHDDEVMAAHPGRPTPAEHVANGATVPPPRDDG
jgi:hypothetical protein